MVPFTIAAMLALVPPGNVTAGCGGNPGSAVDYFPDKIRVEDATHFRVEYHRSYKVVTVRPGPKAAAPERYVLVQCGTPPPLHESASSIVTVPIATMYAGSPTHLSSLVELNRVDALTGVSRRSDLIGDALEARAATGLVREFAATSVVDAEFVVSQRPSLVMTTEPGSSATSVIRNAGVPVAVNVEWQESTALGRAEWVKFVALFLNEERAATTHYAAMKARYRALSSRATAATTRPRVMTGRSTNGRFVIAGGRSYVSALIADAGGQYVWADNPSAGTAAVDFEEQIQRAANADVWINGGGWKNREMMLVDEPRYAIFKAYQTRQVWVYERRMMSSGSNEYWSRSVNRPDVLLADLIKILHPRLMRDHAFEWYMTVVAP
jgi:iron complex transport system substrate-binding protein